MNKLATFLECNTDKENSLNARSSDANALGNKPIGQSLVSVQGQTTITTFPYMRPPGIIFFAEPSNAGIIGGL